MTVMQEAIKNRILVLDGAMGTMLQGYGLTEDDFRGERFAHLAMQQKGNNELLVLTRPDIIADVHERYLKVGVDIIETNTFNAQRISLADYGCENLVEEINREAVRIAKASAAKYSTPGKPRFVVASVGPTNKSLSISPDVSDPATRSITFDELASAYEEQMRVLIAEGVDGLLIETIFDTLNTKAALFAAEQAMQSVSRRVPLMLSVTIADKGGRTLSGQTLRAFLASVAHADIFSVGLNCSFGAKDMYPFIKELSQTAPYYISAHPNAGLPDAMGKYEQTPDAMAEQVRPYIADGLVNIIGGCCGTTDAHIAKYQDLLKDHEGVKHNCPQTASSSALSLSGLDALKLVSGGFLKIGERCNVAGSKKFLRLINEKKYDEAVSIARSQVEMGAAVLDINMDDGLLDACSEMSHFVRLLMSEPAVARVPLMIDSSRWEVIIEALKCVQGKCIVNSISLDEGEDAFLRKARELRRYGAAVVVMAFDEKGQATTYEHRIAICKRAYHLLTEKAGLPAHDIIFDPNVLAVCTGLSEHNDYALDFLRATAWIRQNLPGAHVSGGVSNLSFAFRGNNVLREKMHTVFLYLAQKEGMDMAIVNPSSRLRYEDIEFEERELIEAALLGKADAIQNLIDAAPSMGGKISVQVADNLLAWREMPIAGRLQYALISGIADFVETDIEAALQEYPRAVDIIEGPLMEAMNTVGQRFAAGEMFLPQLVKTARTMQKAVEVLSPHIAGSTIGGYTGKLLLATVKGDVHDIGKNIVSVVLACNGYEIIDLGVMCDADVIVKAAEEHHPDIIGLCGLITPSLDEMGHTLRALKHKGISTPVVVGGATTSLKHTALHLAPLYEERVVWAKDASSVVLIAAELMKPSSAYLATLAAEYAQIRDKHEAQKTPLLSLEEARKRRFQA